MTLSMAIPSGKQGNALIARADEFATLDERVTADFFSVLALTSAFLLD